MEVRGDVLLLGALNGLAYGLVAAGLILAFRASRVLNLAHGQVGAFGAAVLAVLVVRWDVPYWTALPLALAVGALVGGLLELTVVRRLRHVPPLMTLVATLGVAQLLQVAAGEIGGREVATVLFPQPAGLPSAQVGVVLLTPAYMGMLVLAPLAVAGLVVLLRHSAFGLALRAASDNPDAARALGVPARSYATAAWALGGALATLTAVLVLPAGGAPSFEALGPSLLLRALAAGVIAGMASLPAALAAGVGIGAVEQVVRLNAAPGVVDVVLLLLVAAALVTRRAPALRRVDTGAWSAFEPWQPLPAPAREVPLVRWSGPVVAGIFVAGAAAVLLVADVTALLTLTVVACSAMVGLSVWIVTGLGGRLTLGQFALAGVGCAAAAAVERRTGNAGLGLVGAAVVPAAVGVLLALCVARAGEFALTALTLAFGLAAPAWLLSRDWALGDGVRLLPLRVGPLESSTTEGSYAMSALVLLVMVLWARSLARSAFGRRLRAVRDNAPVARALGIDATAQHVQAMALGGAVAGIGGALLGHALTSVSVESFPAAMSLDVAVMATIGGLSIATGAVLGAVWIVGLPGLLGLSAAGLAASALGWLLLLLYTPGGFAPVLDGLRRAGARLLLRLSGHDPALANSPPGVAPGQRGDAAVLARAAPVADGAAAHEQLPAQPVLRLEGVRRRFGAVAALDDVDLEVLEGQIVAVIGPNGAGKTTLLDVAGGFERPDGGRVVLRDDDITRLAPERIAARGVARSFQDVDLFPTLTVRELTLLGAERGHGPTAQRRADEALSLFGLEGYADSRIRTLSTGTRRLAELAALLAGRPDVLLLDEPSAGLAQPEAAELAALLRRLRDHAGVAMLVVEHDLSVVAAIADHVVVLTAGRVTATGKPQDLLGSAVARFYTPSAVADEAPAR